MPKRAAATNRPHVTLDQRAAEPLYRQLYERLREQILAGQLEVGARLPSTRTLASELGVSRNTTALAYEMLALEGYIESRVGDGARVARVQPEQTLQAPSGAHGRSTRTGQRAKPDRDVAQETRPPALGRRGHLLLSAPYPGELYGRDAGGVFRTGLPDVASFPFQMWARLVTKHVRQSLASVALYQSGQGYGPLREAIAAHVGIARGVHCSPEQILVTAGAQGALDLAARVLLDAGDRVWVEDPGYLGARGALLMAGARLMPITVDAEGLNVEAGRALSPDARMAVVTPSHQFPTGVTMSLPRRLALLEWAAEAQSWIVEDDYDSEYRYSGRPLEALQGLDSSGHVIYIGTFSKVLFPSLRLGYIIVPSQTLDGFLAARHFTDVHPPLLEQMALADFIAEGHFARHVRKMRLLYLERRDALVDALTRELGDTLEVASPEAGLHLAAWLPAGVSAQAVSRLAAQDGLRILPISRADAQQREGLLFGFASDSPAALRAGAHRLAQALRHAATSETAPQAPRS